MEYRYLFESRSQAEDYVAIARGFADGAEMRDFYKSNPLPGSAGGRVETRFDPADVDVYARRLTVLKLSEV